jgi:hypothetical protein
MKSQTEPNYSREAAAAFPQYGLYPLYYELGHLRATFGAPVAKPDTSGKCENGVDLTIPVNEGPGLFMGKQPVVGKSSVNAHTAGCSARNENWRGRQRQEVR